MRANPIHSAAKVIARQLMDSDPTVRENLSRANKSAHRALLTLVEWRMDENGKRYAGGGTALGQHAETIRCVWFLRDGSRLVIDAHWLKSKGRMRWGVTAMSLEGERIRS